ncbi:MAG: hypothetical protein PVI86_01765, partial [Phycisphaerae bacterium]
VWPGAACERAGKPVSSCVKAILLFQKLAYFAKTARSGHLGLRCSLSFPGKVRWQGYLPFTGKRQTGYAQHRCDSSKYGPDGC